LAKKKRGRPPHGEYPEKSEVMNFRIRPDTKRLLAQAARASGRTLSGETEHQLRRAVAEMGTGRTHAVMTTIGRAIDGFVKLKTGEGPERDWWTDPYLFAAARRIVWAALDLFKPPGAMTDDAAEPDIAGRPEFEIEAILREIQLFDETKPFVKQTPYERWLGMMKKDLGPAADRPSVWGEGAEQAREWSRRMKDILSEYVPLSRKARDTMTPEETERFYVLRDTIENMTAKLGRKINK
jgi:hypothetical protein